jgi:preprotein translocase subunit SecG
MLDKVLFWVVLVWMVGMLVMAFIAVREVWRDSNLPPEDEGEPGSKPGDSNASGGGKVGGA